MLKMTGRKRVIQGGTSAGKTYGLLIILANEAIRTPNLQISVIGPTMPHLRKGAMKDFKDSMTSLNRWKDSQWLERDLKYTYHNGSYIEFFSADQPDKVKGPRRDIAYLNECDLMPFMTYHHIMIRTNKITMMDFNPSHRFWVHSEVLKDPEASFLKLTYKDNEALSEDMVREIESAQYKTSKFWQNWWKVYGLGEVGSLIGACIPDYEVLDSLPQEARLISYGLDWGYSIDPTSLVAIYEWNGGYIYHELIYKKALLNRDISALLNDLGINDIIYADNAEPKSIDELRYLGHDVFPAPKGADSIRYGLNLINQNPVYVTRKSENLIKELQNYTWKTDKDGEELPKPVDKFNHAIDAIRYGLMGHLENPTRGEYFVY